MADEIYFAFIVAKTLSSVYEVMSQIYQPEAQNVTNFIICSSLRIVRELSDIFLPLNWR